MKRSEINAAIGKTIETLNHYHIKLPYYAYRTRKDWQSAKDEMKSLEQTMIGWDVTDFGMGDFEKMGAVLFTLRNGDNENAQIGTPYAEKLIVLLPGQRLPLHMHKQKTEDIISRAGSAYEIKLFEQSDCKETGEFLKRAVGFDSILRNDIKAGETLTISNGNSITLSKGLYHTFWADSNGSGAVIGEVSSVNDDTTDNYFAEEVARFAEVEEDAVALYPLCNEYGKWIHDKL